MDGSARQHGRVWPLNRILRPHRPLRLTVIDGGDDDVADAHKTSAELGLEGSPQDPHSPIHAASSAPTSTHPSSTFVPSVMLVS